MPVKGDVEAPEVRFWRYVERRGPNECWEWSGGRDRKGYGTFNDGRSTPAKAHRWLLGHLRGAPLRWEPGAYEMACHTCDNPPCVNPAHLYVGDNSRNQQDAVERGRWSSGNVQKTHCKRGHEFTPENTRRNPRGERVCRACDRDIQRARRSR